MTVRDALNSALDEEMARDDKVSKIYTAIEVMQFHKHIVSLTFPSPSRDHLV